MCSDEEEEDKLISGTLEEDNRGATTLTEHQFKKEGFNPFHHVACIHCHKSIRGIGKAYQCQGASAMSILPLSLSVNLTLSARAHFFLPL
jgi:hypothetical protein